ncbi:MAG: TldD/PmbA family protein [Anaerolineaceae bacterium]|nr:TldD/PmbA family protein [Anaerolineaceae bacterium]
MNIMKELLKKAEQVEVVNLQNETTTVSFEANRLKSCSVAQTKGTAVRVVRDGRLGFAASSDEKAMIKLASNVLESATYGDQLTLKFPTLQPAQQVRTFDQKIVDLSIPRLVEIGQEILDLALPLGPDVRANLTLTRDVQSTNLMNQTGLEVAFERSPLSFQLDITRIVGDDVLIVVDLVGTTQWNDDYLRFANRLVEQLKMASKLTTMRSGSMPVIFSPFGALALALPLHRGLNGKNVYKGISPMSSKIGEKLFDEKITLIDDGTLHDRPGSAPYDDEGVPHKRNVLVDKGVLKGFIYDLRTAALFNVESTGNAERSLFSQPEPASTNFIIQSGETPLKDMIGSVKEGILVESLLGLGLGNIISGAFSNPLALAFKIENGEIVGRVKDMSIAGNIYDLLKNVEAVSQESEWVYNSFHAPYVLLPQMNVVSKE